MKANISLNTLDIIDGIEAAQSFITDSVSAIDLVTNDLEIRASDALKSNDHTEAYMFLQQFHAYVCMLNVARRDLWNTADQLGELSVAVQKTLPRPREVGA